jgi:hypothetical protein
VGVRNGGRQLAARIRDFALYPHQLLIAVFSRSKYKEHMSDKVFYAVVVSLGVLSATMAVLAIVVR